MDPVSLAESAAAAFRRGDVHAAIEGFRTLHAAAPGNAEIIRVLAMLLMVDRQHREALDLLTTLPAAHDTMLAASTCAQALDRMDDARRFADRALQIDPSSTDAKIQIANVRSILGMRGGTERHPDPHESRDDLPAYTLIRNGLLHEGLTSLADLLALRPSQPGSLTLPTLGREVPRWNGERVDHLVVILNEGFGDALMWMRHLSAAAARCRRLSVVALKALHGMIDFEVVDPEHMDDVLRHADAYTIGALLPLAVEAEYEPAGGYLKAEPLDMGEGFIVGVCWAGNAANPTDRYRSATPEDIEPLRATGCRFVSLTLNDEGRPDCIEPSPIPLTDFAATARVVAGCNLVISVDTSVCHLAGALGVPTWIAVAKSACWRWQLHPTRTNWYDSATLWRQTEGWREVFERMAPVLANQVKPWAVCAPLLTSEECDDLLRLAEHWKRGRLAGDVQDDTHRHCDEARIDAPDWLLARLAKVADEADRVLGTDAGPCGEVPILARYGVGEFFNWHRDEHGTDRRAMSITIQLSDPADYEGGELRVMRPDGPEYVTAPTEKGVATFFPSTLLHAVTPVTRGVRRACVVWLYKVTVSGHSNQGAARLE